MTDFRTDTEAAAFTVEQVNGRYDPRKPGMEANTGAMAYPTPSSSTALVAMRSGRPAVSHSQKTRASHGSTTCSAS